MKKFVLAILFATVSIFAKINVIVSVPPQETFVKKIGGEHVNVLTMVQPGNSPHTYEPKPSQMRILSNANIYFSIGVEFEKAWLNKFKAQNKNLKIIDISKGVKRVQMDSDNHHKEDTKNHKHSGLDPHIWTSPSNVKIIAKNIYNELVKIDPKNQDYYKQHYSNFLSEIDKTNKKIKELLKNIKPNSKFLVFHPAWGYFAKEYNLIQIPIEIEGKEPKPKDLANIISEAKKEKVKIIFAQPEFSDKSAKIIANEIGIKVVKISPLNPNWSQNLINMAKAIAE